MTSPPFSFGKEKMPSRKSVLQKRHDHYMPVINMKYYPVIGGLSPANIMIPNEQINIMEHHVGVLNTAHVTKLKESSAKVKISVTVTPSAS